MGRWVKVKGRRPYDRICEQVNMSLVVKVSLSYLAITTNSVANATMTISITIFVAVVVVILGITIFVAVIINVVVVIISMTKQVQNRLRTLR